jgi:uncharacterized repeat protein (TIGR03803 family)
MNNTQQQRKWISRTCLAAGRAVLALAMVLVSAIVTTPSAQAQTVTTLHAFDGADGETPLAAMIQGADGNLYGTTRYGGVNNDGTVFKMTPSGTLTTLHSFDGADGTWPFAGLVQAANGNFYGTTYNGGANGDGTVFEITPGGKLTTLYSFCSQSGCTDGEDPHAGLIQATNGNFYGTTIGGGTNGLGTVFEITAKGALTTLHSFNGADGCIPYAGLVQASNGNFYGTTYNCSPYGDGTVFEITPAGTLTTLYKFCFEGGFCADGADPYAALIQASNGNLYGTTVGGGAYGTGFDGTVFEITPSGTLTTVYSFCPDGCTDGDEPYAGLVQATNGNFYGTTLLGGTEAFGTLFEITPSGTLTTLYTFDITDGENPAAGLVQATNGVFYGTTEAGGANLLGTVFSLSVGLGPFVETQPTSGKVGAAVRILGTSLTGATSVTFNGTAATFKVVSKSEITTTVPTGATTGTVEVTTSRGTLKSNTKFRVTP